MSAREQYTKAYRELRQLENAGLKGTFYIDRFMAWISGWEGSHKIRQLAGASYDQLHRPEHCPHPRYGVSSNMRHSLRKIDRRQREIFDDQRFEENYLKALADEERELATLAGADMLARFRMETQKPIRPPYHHTKKEWIEWGMDYQDWLQRVSIYVPTGDYIRVNEQTAYKGWLTQRENHHG